MRKISLEISDENVDTVVMILNNLKSGLIENIHVDSKKTTKQPSYNPKTNIVIKEGENISGKYMSATNYKKRLKK